MKNKYAKLQSKLFKFNFIEIIEKENIVKCGSHILFYLFDKPTKIKMLVFVLFVQINVKAFLVIISDSCEKFIVVFCGRRFNGYVKTN